MINENSFVNFKLNTYKVLLPFIVIATFIANFLEQINDVNDVFNKYALPIIFGWFLVLVVTIYVKSSLFFKLEIVNIPIFCTLFLIKFWVVVHYQIGQDGHYYGFGEFFDWLPLLFIYIYFTFDRVKAFWISFLFWIITIIIGIHRVLFFPVEPEIYNPLIIFYLSNIVYILALHFLQKLKEGFIDSDAYQKLANSDFLTNLPNRRHMHELLLREVNKSNHKVSIVLLDIDNFKKVNDHFGHDIGDIVLKEFSSTIKKMLKDDNIIGRWGGEEFLIILPNMSIIEAQEFTNRIKEQLENSPIQMVGIVTASFGVAEYQQNDEIQTLLKRADMALYEAKGQGKNCIRCG